MVSRPLLRILVVCSGALALIYETIWFRLLAQAVGSTLISSVVTISFFLVGNALGAIALQNPAWLAHRKPLRLFAKIEVVAAVSFLLLCLGFPLFFRLFSRFSPLALSLWLGGLFALPAFMLGSTFPVLARAARKAAGIHDNPPAFVYRWNLAGASLGVLLAGMIFIPYVGIWGAILIASLLGIGLALLAFWAGSSPVVSDAPEWRRSEGGKPTSGLHRSSAEVLMPWGELVLVLLAFAFVSMSVEGIALRLLFLTCGNTSLCFSIAIFVFLLFSFSGSYASRRIRAEKQLRLAIGMAPFVMAIGLVWIVRIYPLLPYLYVQWLRPSASVPAYTATVLCMSVILLALPCFGMGLFLPAVLAFKRRPDERREASAGWMYGIYGFGNVAGVAVTMIYLIPTTGTFRVLLGFVAFSLLLSTFLVGRLRREAAFKIVVAEVIVLGIPLLYGASWETKVMHPGSFSAPAALKQVPFSEYYGRRWGEVRTLYAEEGPMANVAVFRSTSNRMLVINGKVDAGMRRDMTTQALLGQIPYLYAHGPVHRTLVVGLGSGITSAAARGASSGHVTTVELLPEVARAAESGFPEYAETQGDSPYYDLIVQDAALHVAATRRTYDVIIQEPTNFWIRGSSPLVSMEHLRQAARIMPEDGIFAQWVHLYWMDNKLLFDVLRTVQAVFPHVEAYGMSPGDLLLVAGKKKLRINRGRLQSLFKGKTRKTMEKMGFFSPINLLALRALSQEQVPKVLRQYPGMVFSRYRPMLESRALRCFLQDKTARFLAKEKPGRWEDPYFRSWVAKGLGKSDIDDEDVYQVLRGCVHALSAHPPRTYEAMRYLTMHAPEYIPRMIRLFEYLESAGHHKEFRFMLNKMLSWRPGSKILRQRLGS